MVSNDFQGIATDNKASKKMKHRTEQTRLPKVSGAWPLTSFLKFNG